MFWRRVTLLRDNYVLSPKLLGNRLFNRLTIFRSVWRLFDKILLVFLHLWMVKNCFGLYWFKSYGHFTIFRSVRIFVNRTETHPFAILSESNHAQILLWKKTNTLSSFLILIIRLYNHYYEILPSQLQYENWAFTIAKVTIFLWFINP